MEDVFVIQGGRKISGDVELSGAKNLALKVIIASMLFKKPVILENIPKINDVRELIDLIKALGVIVREVGDHVIEIDSSTIRESTVDLLHASRMRVSFLLFAPLLHLFGTCRIPNPGGCRLGLRPIDRVIAGIEALGAECDYDSLSGYYTAQMKASPEGSYSFPKPSHTGTELLIMYAVIGSGETRIHNAAQEPEIDELIRFLNECGAKIARHGRDIVIHGVVELTQHKPFRIFSDRIEAATFSVLGIATGGVVRVGPIDPKYLETYNSYVKKAGARVRIDGEYITYEAGEEIKPVDVTTAVHPGFITDWQPIWSVLMTQAGGTSTVHETIFENRFSYVPELKKLGAHISYVDPKVHNPHEVYQFNYESGHKYNQAIQIEGGQPLHGGALKITDLRAGATLLIAALIASGESVLQNASILERGYEDIVHKVSGLGGSIKRV